MRSRPLLLRLLRLLLLLLLFVSLLLLLLQLLLQPPLCLMNRAATRLISVIFLNWYVLAFLIFITK